MEETMMAFIFEDQETPGQRQIGLGENEGTARAQLDGVWENMERTKLVKSCTVAELSALVREAQAAEREAFDAWHALPSVVPLPNAAPEQIAEQSKRQRDYDSAKAYRRDLERLESLHRKTESR